MPRGLERYEDASVGPKLHAVLRQRRAEQIPAESLQPSAIVGRHAHLGVQIVTAINGEC